MAGYRYGVRWKTGTATPVVVIRRIVIMSGLVLLAACAGERPAADRGQMETRGGCIAQCNRAYDICMDRDSARRDEGAVLGARRECSDSLESCMAWCGRVEPSVQEMSL